MTLDEVRQIVRGRREARSAYGAAIEQFAHVEAALSAVADRPAASASSVQGHTQPLAISAQLSAEAEQTAAKIRELTKRLAALEKERIEALRAEVAAALEARQRRNRMLVAAALALAVVCYWAVK